MQRHWIPVCATSLLVLYGRLYLGPVLQQASILGIRITDSPAVVRYRFAALATGGTPWVLPIRILPLTLCT